MKINLVRVFQIGFGLILMLFGANAYFSFLPIPEKEGFALEFLNNLHQAKYMFPVIAIIMITTGTLLLLDRGVALVLLMQLPISFNIFAFHLFHDWQGLIPAYIIFGMNMFLILRCLRQYKILFSQ